MKKKIVSMLALCLGISLNAQDYTRSLDGIEWVKIESKADVTVRTHSSNELLIKSSSRYNEPDRAKGLRLVGAGGTDNTEVGFYVIKEGSTLIVQNLRKSEEAEIFLPASQNISVKSQWQGDIEVSGFKGEIEASARLNGSVRVENISGPLTANSLNGNVEVEFSEVSQNSPITIFSTNGELDISLPSNTPADLEMGTINGEIYTNFDIQVPEKDGMRAVVSRKIGGVINKGGVKIQLKTTNGNIYLRKQ